MGDCESANDTELRIVGPADEEDLKKALRESQYNTSNRWTNGCLVKVLILLGCLLLVTSSLQAIFEKTAHHRRVYPDRYSNFRVPSQEDALRWSERNNSTQQIVEQKGNVAEDDAVAVASETAMDTEHISPFDSEKESSMPGR